MKILSDKYFLESYEFNMVKNIGGNMERVVFKNS